jgi:hypothetical protein
VALHVKALSGDLLRELAGKATIADTQQLFDAMHKQFLSLREAHRVVGTAQATLRDVDLDAFEPAVAAAAQALGEVKRAMGTVVGLKTQRANEIGRAHV